MEKTLESRLRNLGYQKYSEDDNGFRLSFPDTDFYLATLSYNERGMRNDSPHFFLGNQSFEKMYMELNESTRLGTPKLVSCPIRSFMKISRRRLDRMIDRYSIETMADIYMDIYLNKLFPYYLRLSDTESALDLYIKGGDKISAIDPDFRFRAIPILYLLMGQKEAGIEFIDSYTHNDPFVKGLFQPFIDNYKKTP